MLRPLLLATAVAMAHAVITDNCTAFDPMVCTSDANIYCFTDGTTVVGSCDANNKTCFPVLWSYHNVMTCENGVLAGTNNECPETTTPAENGGIYPNTNFQTIVVLSLAAGFLKLTRTA